MTERIPIDDFKKIEITVGEVLSAEPVAGSEKLLRLQVTFGSKPTSEGSQEPDIRQVVSGIAKHFPDPSSLVGKKCAFVTNLEPRSIMGLQSQAMIMATGGDGDEPLFLFESSAEPGSRAR